ncbi:MAG: DNA repair protein RecN [Clostridia bacterium]|nr:DNA repair protein RecN [Clostridia bacterium]
MLTSLNIKNIALIDECRLSLGKGLNILSGETGAGKSIIIDALSFVLGCRADKSLIRFGEKQATVEAVFEVENPDVLSLMEELGLQAENTIIIKRTMTDSRNDIRVNGEPFTISMLKRLTSLLVDILGQHEHQSLLKTSNHIELLDKYAGDEAVIIKKEVFELYNEYSAIRAKIEQLGDSNDRARKLDILKYQINEIETAELKEGEEAELFALRDKYRNSEKIVGAVSGAYNAIDSQESSIISALSIAMSYLSPVAVYDNTLAELLARLDSAKIELNDIAYTLRAFADGFEYDERTANRIEQRVDTIKLLKRKYGNSVEAILATLSNYIIQYEELNNAEEQLDKLNNALSKLTAKLYNKAVTLSKLRRSAAISFEKRIISELQELAMKGTDFKVNMADMPDIEMLESAICANGFDQVDFLISPNKGEPLKPLVKIASGGEMSRIMLSLQNIISGLDGIETLVFDEIDTGISGYVAQVVAVKLNNISRNKQIIAITHLPQLASFADNHYLISKSVLVDKTITELTLLSENSRISEVVRLSGGVGSDISRLHAKELLQSAEKIKRA